MCRSALSSLFLFSLLAAAFAQGKAPEPTATVSGHVYSGDRNAPLRMADVFLIPTEQIDKCVQGSGKGYQLAPSVRVEKTLLDGSFAVAGVRPGVYYVIAVQNGYINSLEELRMLPAEESSNQEKRAKLLKKLPTISVESSQPLVINVTLMRGGSISGTVVYDDGSPACSIRLSVLYRFQDQWKEFPSDGEEFNPASISDDAGHYRLNGLPTGEYIVKADLQITNGAAKLRPGSGHFFYLPQDFDLIFYSGNTSRPSEAVGFQLGEGESRSGEDIEISLGRLHSISGHLTAASDGHLLSAGNVTLLNADDRSQFASTSLPHDETAFNFHFVPEGDYILRVEWAEDANYQEPQSSVPVGLKHTIKSYTSTEQRIHITGDQTDLVIALPSKNSSEAAK